MADTFGTIVKEARKAKALTQEALAELVGNLTKSDVSKIESKGHIPEAGIIRKMAKPLGLKANALLEAAGLKESADKKTAAKKTADKKTTAKKAAEKTTAKKAADKTTAKKAADKKTTAKKTADKKTTAKKTTDKKTTAKKAEEEIKLTAAEKKLIEAYRKADSDTKKSAMKVLNGEAGIGDLLGGLFSGKASKAEKESAKKEETNPILSLFGGKNGELPKDAKDALSTLFGGALGKLSRERGPERGPAGETDGETEELTLVSEDTELELVDEAKTEENEEKE